MVQNPPETGKLETGKLATGLDEQSVSCLNCNIIVQSNYCANCGQARHVHRSLGALWHDFLHGVLHFDGKFWRTLPMLIFKPGVLTREYIAGKRAGYISPMAIFLFSIFLMFAVFSFMSAPTINDEQFDSVNGGVTENLNNDLRPEIAVEIARIESELAAGKILNDKGESNADDLASLKQAANALALVRGEKAPFSASEGEAIQMSGFEEISTGWAFLDERLRAAPDLVRNNSDFLLYKIKSNGYKFSWLLIPISLPFIWFAMIGVRGHPVYDHAIFTILSISFMTILIIILAVLGTIGLQLDKIVPALLIIPIIHLYKHVKYAYQLSRLHALLRLLLIIFAIFFSVLIFLFVLLLLGILS